ncbi:MAG: glycosyltransferase family 4 protein [Candidatus Niyogibacteria bacterium]|nr:glycosyltransferase family 4 protein [Candidatus Niyogibacteria bacterium]
MKILLATPLYPPEIGGPATYTKELAEQLKNKHHLKIVAYAGKNPQLIDGVELIFIDKFKPLFYRLFLFFLAIFKHSKDADVIYVQNALAAGLPAVLAAKLRQKPVVLKFVGDEAWERAYAAEKTKKNLTDFLQNPDGGFKSRLYLKIQKFVLKRIVILTTPSKYLGEEIIKAYALPQSSFLVNYNAAKQKNDYYEEDKLFAVEKKKHQLLTTARLVSWKGIDGIIEAVSILKNKIPDLKLVIAGDGPEMDNFKKKAKDCQADKMVNFIGRVSQTQTRYLRRESEIYILNSVYEGLPHTVLSSFSAGIPVIATNIPGTDEAVYDGVTGLLVPPNNPQKLAETIEKLLGNKELQNKLITGAEKILQEKFSWDAHLNTLLGIFYSVLAEPRG